MYEVEILTGMLKGETRHAFSNEGVLGYGFIVLDKGEELWYESGEVRILSDVLGSDCE